MRRTAALDRLGRVEARALRSAVKEAQAREGPEQSEVDRELVDSLGAAAV